MFDHLFKRTPAIRPEYLAEPANPLTIRLRHIDIELGKLAAQRPRTEAVWAAIDFQLDRRLDRTGGRAS